MENNRSSHLGTSLLVIAVIAVVIVTTMMFGAKLGFWQPIVGFGLVRTYMNLIAYGLLGLGVLGFVQQKIARNSCGVIKSSLTALIGLAMLAPTLYGKINPPVRLPPIHDISTNTVTPPEFLILDDNRVGARNTLVYGGPEVAVLQNKAYSDIAPIESGLSAAEAFNEALRVADIMGWELVAQDVENLRYEATARTSVYGFVDDVVVVVTPVGDVSRIDIRSVSRIGRGDRGVNAARVRAFIKTFEG
ncbi:hypothetical protein MUS1_13755 [Marinomonas ushuaiensis DSM 15871]|uniref:DUF1499 domain-containing protein n=1 Tax=Marinomonas ushuaiensis DSM 15871 TaxID=1122207 RepID=X7E3J7_9GAMM|nr:DUF1499 domain-containing protein [Marinomonas ushuaiensis]ETX10644.1 hypothetical protein MUS1_13755 [Marinomonas ushuaiensis DSM 15871]